MIYIHYCGECDFLHLLSGHRIHCPGCGEKLAELKLSYQEYFRMDGASREELLLQCANPDQLRKMTFHYKKHKFSKWFREGRQRG